MRLTLIISFLLSFGVPMAAQTSIATQDNGWYMYFGNHRLNDRLGIHTEYQWRRHNWLPAWQQSLLRLGLDYHFDANNSLTVGYAWVVSYPYGEQPIAQEFTEHRIWEQLVFTHRAGVLYVHHRYRLEQRYLERPAQSDYAFRQRARYRLLLTLPISERDLQDDSFFLATYAEPFIGFGKGIGRNVLDQNRLYIALGYRFNPNVNIQAGYLNQYIIKIDGIHHERNHNFQLGMTYNIDFRM
jgi:hypothetical protein